jgi:DNA-binding MarR family transcriptional regulator
MSYIEGQVSTMSSRLDRSRIDKAEIIAGLLGAIERDRCSSQRGLAQELGIALGLVNAYLKRCTKKGLIKIREAPASRYAYYVTPKGLAEKTRLTAEFLTYSLGYFKRARLSLSETFAVAANVRGWRKVALVGSGELAEIAILCALEHDVEVVSIVDQVPDAVQFGGKPVVGDLKKIEQSVDGLIVTAMREPQSTYDLLVAEAGADKVLVPSVLEVATRALKLGTARQ